MRKRLIAAIVETTIQNHNSEYASCVDSLVQVLLRQGWGIQFYAAGSPQFGSSDLSRLTKILEPQSIAEVAVVENINPIVTSFHRAQTRQYLTAFTSIADLGARWSTFLEAIDQKALAELAQHRFWVVPKSAFFYLLIRTYYYLQWWLHTLMWHVKDRVQRALMWFRRQVFHRIFEVVRSYRWRVLNRVILAIQKSMALARSVLALPLTSAAVLARIAYWRFGYNWIVEPITNLWRKLRWSLWHPIETIAAKAMSKVNLRGVWPVKRSKRKSRPRSHDVAQDQTVEALANLFANWSDGDAPDLVVYPQMQSRLMDALLAASAVADLHAPLRCKALAIVESKAPAIASASTAPAQDLAQRKRHWQSGGPHESLLLVPCGSEQMALAIDCLLSGRPSECDTWHCANFGPLALNVSALWGRVGSTAIFDAQSQWLLDRGYRLGRVYIDHWPHTGAARAQRLSAMIDMDRAVVRPHYSLVLERNDGSRALRDLYQTKGFADGSPVMRLAQQLAVTTPSDKRIESYFQTSAALAVVNHTQHILAARKLTSAPIVLETHDMITELMDIHGIPRFVTAKPDSKMLRWSDETKLLKLANHCIALSADDFLQIAPEAHGSCLVQPPAPTLLPTSRSWAEIVAAHAPKGWSTNAKASDTFDILIWGSWHDNNVRSAIWFFEEVYPRLKEHKRLRIGLAGQIVTGLSNKMRVSDQIILMPDVDNIADILIRTILPVIPDREGTGISIKVMDAVALRTSFVATPVALRGIELKGVGYGGASDAVAMVTDIDTLLLSYKARQTRKTVAGKIAARNYSQTDFDHQWQQIFDGLDLATPDSLKQSNAIQQSSNKGVAKKNPERGLSLSVVVATFERYDVLGDALRALKAQSLAPKLLQIIVVDNSRDQEFAKFNAGRYFGDTQISYILEPKCGLSNARNVGISHATGDVVAFVDDDALVDKDYATKLLEAFTTPMPKVRPSVVGGRVLPRFVQPPPSWLKPQLRGYLSVVDWPGKARVVAEGEWLAGCNMAFDRKVFAKYGQFNPALGRMGSSLSLISNEDTEFVERIKAGGGAVVYDPAVVAEHVIDPRRRTANWFRRRSAWQGLSEFVNNPDKTGAYAQRAAARVLQEGARCRAVLLDNVSDTAPAPSTEADIGLYYDLAVSLLAATNEISGNPAGTPEQNSEVSIAPQIFATAHRSVKARGKVARPTLTVVVATYCRYDTLPLAIASLHRQILPGGRIEIIIVDNSPDHGRANAFAQQFKTQQDIVYHIEKTPGLSNARNVGLGLARASTVAFIDDDAIAAPDWARHILDAFEKFPNAGCVGGLVVAKYQSVKPVWLSDKVTYFLSLIDWGADTRELAAEEWIVGCNMAFQTKVLLNVGGFSSALGRNGSSFSLLSNEESDVVERLQEQGFSTIYAGGAKVQHLIDPSRLTQKWFRRRAAWQAASFFIQNPETAFAAAKASMWNVERLAKSRPAGVPIGTFHHPADPKRFHDEVILAYDMMMVVLAGGGAALRQ